MTRYIAFGAGAIGGVVGALLAQPGHDVALAPAGVGLPVVCLQNGVATEPALMMNLGNAVEAASGRVHGNGEILEAIRAEAAVWRWI